MNLIVKKISKKVNFKSFFRFFFSTIISFLLSYSPYIILLKLGLNYVYAYVIACIILLISSTLLNIRYSFRVILKPNNFLIYLIYNGIYFILGYLIIKICIENLEINPFFAPLFNVILLPLNFLLSRIILFKTSFRLKDFNTRP